MNALSFALLVSGRTAARLLAAAILSSLAAGLLPARAQAPDHAVWLPLVQRRQPAANPVHTGIATYYDATGNGACLFGESPHDLLVAAMNNDQYGQADYCGAYVQVTGRGGTVTVRIVDLCPECEAGHLDLSREAFALIDEPRLGRVPITWQVVSPELSGPIAYHFKDGSNPWWTAVQVRNHRNPIARLEAMLEGEWVEVPRTGYNYFVQTEPGLGAGPYTFRVTDAYGSELVDTGIPHIEQGTIAGAAQFPPGP
jgi:expansin (peptidoglycan-binding protein)